MDFTGERFIVGGASDRVKNDHITRYDFIKKFVKDKLVLDIASGSGYGTQKIAEFGAKKVCGVDVSKEAIEYSKKENKNDRVEFICKNATGLDCFENEKFDTIVSFETIEHMGEEDADKYLQEFHRVLKSDGVVILSTPNKNILSPGMEKPGNHFHIREYDHSELIAKFEKNNFKVVEDLGQRIVFRFYNILFVRRFMDWLGEKILKRRINVYFLADGPQIRSYSIFKEPRYYVFVLKKK